MRLNLAGLGFGQIEIDYCANTTRKWAAEKEIDFCSGRRSPLKTDDFIRMAEAVNLAGGRTRDLPPAEHTALYAVIQSREGAGVLLPGGQELLPGGLLVIRLGPGFRLEGRAGWRGRVLAFDPRVFSGAYSYTLGWEAVLPFERLADKGAGLCPAGALGQELDRVLRELCGTGESRLLAVACLWRLAGLLYQALDEEDKTAGRMIAGGYGDRLAAALDYIHLHYSSRITLAELARHVNMSVSNFSSVFRRAMGQPPMDYLFRLRLRRSAYLLCHTDKKIIDIAEDCGFFSISNFIKSFHNSVGMTPSEYRRRAAEDPAWRQSEVPLFDRPGRTGAPEDGDGGEPPT